MATAAKKEEAAPGYGSRIDPQPSRVTVDAALNEVSAGSEAAAFVYAPADLERVRARREELGLNDDRERVQRESAKAELSLAKRRLAQQQQQVSDLEAMVAEGESKGSSKEGAAKA